MKKIILLALLTIAVVTAHAEASFCTEVQIEITEEKTNYTPNIYATYFFNDCVGISSFVLVGEKWAEYVIGPISSPASWVEIGFNVGVEQADDSPKTWRTATSLWLGHGRYSSLGIFEKGGGGWWYTSRFIVQATDWLRGGVMAQRFAGIGPRVEISIPHTPITIWGAGLHDLEGEDSNNAIIGIKANF